MASFSINNVEIVGVSACVPKQISENISLSIWEADGANNFINATGVKRRRISEQTICSSDLCECAANDLICDLEWDKNTIDCLIFVSQTPDFILPSTSAILQDKLELSKDCYTLDISLGCSGWVYGLSTISSLMASGGMKRGLLLVGDTVTKICSPDDKSTFPLFGDAGTATALEYKESFNALHFQMNSDGSGQDAIKLLDGRFRNLSFIPDKDRIKPCYLKLDGMNVFSFGISKAPECIQELILNNNINKEGIDYFLFHQANLFMNEKIRKKLKLNSDKVPYSLSDFGNTSCASIPLTMVTQLREQLMKQKLSLIACGFGVGLSWGSAFFKTDKIVCSKLKEI